MKTGRSLEEIAGQIIEDSKSKRDFIAPTEKLTMQPDTGLQFTVDGEEKVYQPTATCLGQVTDRVGIPRRYAERMQAEAPGLLAHNVNTWFNAKPERRMLRTFDNGNRVARAFLSDRYRALDNYDLMNAVLPHLSESGCEVKSIELTERRLYVQAVTPRLEGVIEQARAEGGHHTIKRPVQAGVVISNSEIGAGAIAVEPLLFELVCTNGLILPRTLRRHHVGRRNEGGIFGDDASFEVFSDDTRKLDDRAFWAKVNDVVQHALGEDGFRQNLLTYQATTEQRIDARPTEIAEVTATRFKFSDAEQDSLLEHLATGGDFSKYGLIQAVTRTAQDAADYDRAIELERLGGQIIELPPSDFAKS